MPKEETVICVACPLGCEVSLTIDDKGEVTKVTGYKCKEGEAYAIEEYRNPVRVLPATVRTIDSKHPLLPVRTSKPILKGLMLQGMHELAKVRVKPPVKIGQPLITNLLGTGADVITTWNLID